MRRPGPPRRSGATSASTTTWSRRTSSGSDDAGRWAGTIVSARQLADAYGITDADGSKPDCWGYLAEYGWEREDGAGIDDYRLTVGFHG
jgi:hypothetical protein